MKAPLTGNPVIGSKIWIGATPVVENTPVPARIVAAEVGHDREAPLEGVFQRQGGRPAPTERGRVGQEVRRGAVGTGDAEEVQVVRVEVEERRGATGGDAGELDERLVQRDLVLAAAEEVDADRRLGVALADGCSGVELAGAAGKVEADERTQGAIGGLRAGVEVQAANRAEARVVLRELARRGDVVLEPGEARHAQARLRAWDVEEPDPVGRADTHVLDRRGLPDGKVGGLCPGNRGETRGGPEEKALHELHSDLQSFETLGAELPCLIASGETANHLTLFPLAFGFPTGAA
jgi:hypothetical protein